MRILMLVRGNSLQDGINRHILTVAPAINCLSGYEVAVCTTYAVGEFQQRLEKAGVRTYALNLPHGHSLKTWRRFRGVLNDFRPDVIHAHSMSLMERLYLGVFCRKLPIVETCHGLTGAEAGMQKASFRDYVEAFLLHVLPGKIRATIFISRGVAIARGCSDGVVAYNPMPFNLLKDSCHSNKLKSELGVPLNSLLIGTACRVASVKRPHLFVSVMCNVLRELPQVHAIVCGTSQDVGLMASLERQVKELGVSDRFHWLGYRKDAPLLVRDLDCFVLTSATEGMPTALLEAISWRTPIAFMRGRGGLVDLDELNRSEGPFAIVANEGDCCGLSSKIIAMLRNPQCGRENAERAYRVAARYFNVGANVEKVVLVYNQVVL